jgi:hypothetical protein
MGSLVSKPPEMQELGVRLPQVLGLRVPATPPPSHPQFRRPNPSGLANSKLAARRVVEPSEAVSLAANDQATQRSALAVWALATVAGQPVVGMLPLGILAAESIALGERVETFAVRLHRQPMPLARLPSVGLPSAVLPLSGYLAAAVAAAVAARLGISCTGSRNSLRPPAAWMPRVASTAGLEIRGSFA